MSLLIVSVKDSTKNLELNLSKLIPYFSDIIVISDRSKVRSIMDKLNIQGKIVPYNNDFTKVIDSNVDSLIHHTSIIYLDSSYLIDVDIDSLFYGKYNISSFFGNNNGNNKKIPLKFLKISIDFYCDIHLFRVENGNLITDEEINIISEQKIKNCSLMMNKRLFNKKKYLTIYAYYEKEGYTKNQTNLQHFVNHGLEIDNMDYIFNINNHKCSVNIPKKKNITVIKRDNCYDFEAWYHCLSEIDYTSYSHIFFINCSVLGPLNLDDSLTITKDWFTPFLEKMKDNVMCCSNIITNFENGHPAGKGPRCTSYCFLLNTKVITELMTKKIFGNASYDRQYKENKEFHKIEYYNSVFSKKIDRKDTILTGEYGLSRVILDMGYQITCLHPGYSDRIGKKLNTIPMTLFMKNNWIDGELRACPPVHYRKCMKIIGKEIPDSPEEFDSLDCEDRGICYTDKEYNWNSKKEFYDKFGYAEEIII